LDVACGRCAGPTIEKDHSGVSICMGCGWHTYWPPVGKHAEVWERFQALGMPQEDWFALSDVLRRWIDDGSTLVAYTDENGEWVDVEWPWPGEGS